MHEEKRDFTLEAKKNQYYLTRQRIKKYIPCWFHQQAEAAVIPRKHINRFRKIDTTLNYRKKNT